MKSKYYLVMLLDTKSLVWHMENGFYSNAEALTEVACLIENGHKRKDIKILACINSSNAIRDAISKLNDKGALV